MSKMSLYAKIKMVYPELTDDDFLTSISLRNDADDAGDYIAEWNYAKPLPDGMKIGK